MSKITITPFLWFDDNLEEAVEFYRSVFPDMKVHGMSRGPGGMLFGAEFEIAGQRLNGMNGGRPTTSTRPSPCSWCATDRPRSTGSGIR